MSDFVIKKYLEFYERNGYIPKMFNPYNVAEITDVAPCVTTNCGGTGCSATVLIMNAQENIVNLGRTIIMTKPEAVEYVEQVLENWSSWHDHHKKLVDAIEILLEEIRNQEAN